MKNKFRKIQDIIYQVVTPKVGGAAGIIYDIIILSAVAISIIPFFWIGGSQPDWVNGIIKLDWLFGTIFLIDYIGRWMIADRKMTFGPKSFLLYPFTLWAMIDLLAIVPAFASGTLQVLLVVRVLKLFRLIEWLPRVNASIRFVTNSITTNWRSLLIVGMSVLILVFTFALILLNIEGAAGNDDVESFGDALWFAFITITTIGYGDITPITTGGRWLTAIMAIVGILIMAMITAIVMDGFSQNAKVIQEEIKELDKIIDKYKIKGKTRWASLLLAKQYKDDSDKEKEIQKEIKKADKNKK